MTKSSNSWDPETRVSFPRPNQRADAKVQFEHDGAQFATAKRWDEDVCFGHESTAVAYFVKEEIFGTWCRISKIDYETVAVRCKSDPTSKLFVAPTDEHHLNIVFRPADFDSYDDTNALIEPPEHEEDVTVICVRTLEYDKVAA